MTTSAAKIENAPIFYDFFKLSNSANVNELYEKIYPYYNDSDNISDYSKFLNRVYNNSEYYNTNNEESIIATQNQRKLDLLKHYDIRRGILTLPANQIYMYNNIVSTLDSEIIKYRRIKNALDNIDYKVLKIPLPKFKSNTNIYTLFKNLNNQIITTGDIITTEKFSQNLLSSDASGALPSSAQKSVYFALTI